MADNALAQILIDSTTVTSATTTYSQSINQSYQVAYVIVDVSAWASAQTLDIEIQAYDPASNAYYGIGGIPFPLSAVETSVYLYGEGESFGADGITAVISSPLPQRWKLAATTSTADSITFSVGLLPVGR